MNMSDYPTPWQRKTMWAALTGFCVVLLIVIIGAVIWVSANIISFLQPILIPVAIAVILTYLLDPLVTKMSRGTLSRTKAVALLFAIAFFALGGLAAWLVPTISIQSANFARQVPAYTERARDYIVDVIYRFDQTFGFLGGGRAKSASTSFTNWLIGPTSSATPHSQPTVSPTPKFSDTTPVPETIASSPPKLTTAERQRIQAYVEKQMPNLQQALPTLLEINSYVTAYFRGQLLVCLVDGILIGSALAIVGLNFAPIIGALVVVLTMVPYIGIIICWIPAVLIAAFQWGDWTHPLIVTAIFILIQNLEGIFYAPRIVGNYVGLHPMTVIVSIFVWGLIIGGVIGPLLAVPLTATVKVLLARYVWGRRLREKIEDSVKSIPVVEEPEVVTRP